jgi:hypothetical protein
MNGDDFFDRARLVLPASVLPIGGVTMLKKKTQLVCATLTTDKVDPVTL